MSDKVKNAIILVQSVLIVCSFSYMVYAAGNTTTKEIYYSGGGKTVYSALEELSGLKGTISLVGDATADHIVEGKALYVQGELVEGEMPNYANKTIVAK